MDEIKILETDSIELEEFGKSSNEVKEIDFDNVSLALAFEEEDEEIQKSDVVLRQKNEEGKEIKYLVLSFFYHISPTMTLVLIRDHLSFSGFQEHRLSRA